MQRFLCALLATLCVLGAFSPAHADYGTGVTLRADGERIDEDGLTFIIDGTAYVPFCETALALGAQMVYCSGGIHPAVMPEGSLSAGEDLEYSEARGRYFYVPGGGIVKNETLFVPARQLARACGARVSWSDGSRSVCLRSGSEVTPGSAFYNEDDVYWLSRIISAESRGEAQEGQIAVGNVVLNRVNSPDFPNSIPAVIFDRKNGVQFEPVSNGTVYADPAPLSVEAARQVLDGTAVLKNALYFYAPSLSQGLWINANRTYLTAIGCHRFYL